MIDKHGNYELFAAQRIGNSMQDYTTSFIRFRDFQIVVCHLNLETNVLYFLSFCIK